ncbi:MAG TPA: hypothetical protein PKC24_11670 [Cyclobacteriaceae bacterium]|nr:hypothetical protein [Cyclobacteriaceae bacterium]
MAKRKKTNDEDLPKENQEGLSSSDENFGLPDIEFEALDREAEPAPASQTASEPQAQQESDSWQTDSSESSDTDSAYTYTPPPPEPIWPKLVMAIVLLVVIGGGAWYFFSYAPAKKAETERLAREAEAKAAEERRLAEERRAADARRREEEENRRRAEELLKNAEPKEGSIEILSERSGRYYVVISSAVDGDLAIDYAKKLSKQGVSTQLIPPFGRSKFHRLTVGNHGSWAEAAASAEGLKGTYGDAVWVIKY